MKILLKGIFFILLLTIVGLFCWSLYKIPLWKNHWYGLAALCFYIITSIITIIIFTQHRHATAKLSWLFVIIVVPIIGPIIYLIFGRRYKGRMNQSEYFKKYAFTTEAQEPSLVNAHQSLKDLEMYSKRPIVKGDISTTRNIMDSFTVLFNDIKKAKKFIHMNYYIIKQSEIWFELKNLLISKSKKGVEIRLIVDDFGSWALPWYEIRSLRKQGVNVQIFNKVTFPFISSQDGFRSHRKYVVIDGNIGHIGGVNITDEYISFDHNYGLWEDAVSRITGKIVKSLSLLFLNDWYLISNNKLSVEKYAPAPNLLGTQNMILIEDGPEINEPILEEVLIKLIYNCKKEIKLSTPYFIPSPEIHKALKVASIAGIKVTIYIPGIWDKRIAFDATRGHATELMKYGVEFRELKDKFIHSKIGTFDKKIGYIGTANIDMRSMFSQLENNLFFEGSKVSELSELFKKYESDSRIMDALILKPKTTLQKWRLIILKILAPMM